MIRALRIAHRSDHRLRQELRCRPELLRQVVDRGAEAAIDDHRVRPRAGLPEGLKQRGPVVAHGRAPMDVEAEFAEATGDMAVVGVDRLTGQNLVAGAQNFDAHVFPWFCRSLDCAGQRYKA